MLSLENLEKAREALASAALHTPIIPAHNLGRLVGAEVWLKLENLQRTGSFKFRGAYVKLSRLAERFPGSRVVAASAGNHAQGVALAARMLGLRATIFMPVNVALSKREATAGYGAEVRLAGESIEESMAEARAMSGEAVLIHPYDDEEIIQGQASVGLEIMDDLDGVEAVVVPVGGGGLIAGVAAAVKQRDSRVKVIGVEPANVPSASAALDAGRPVDVKANTTLADGTRVARVGERNLAVIRGYVDRVVKVREEHIAQAMLLLLERRRIVSEGAGSLPLAAFLAGAVPELDSRKVVLVVSGGNVDPNMIGRIIDQGLVRSGRIYRFSVVLDDRPGALARLLEEVARTQANVLHLHHDRLGKNLPPTRTRVGLELETRGFDHTEDIAAKLRGAGYEPVEE